MKVERMVIMKVTDINIRDPYILLHSGKYYMYGTRSETCWSKAEGFDCYVSEDSVNWEGPIEIFKRPEGFFADRNYWAPECIYYKDKFYLVTTFGGSNRKKGIYMLCAAKPTGPFEIYSDCITPKDRVCIDGTVYIEDEVPYLIYSNSFEDSPEGDMCLIRLSEDLKHAEGEPIKLFSAGDADWARPVPFAKAEFGIDGDVYFTDGPCVMKVDDGRLHMTWSSWSNNGYAVGVAYSESGGVIGPWIQLKEPLFPENGGHGMLYKDGEEFKFVLHFPNDKYKERPIIRKVKVLEGQLKLEDELR